MTCLPIYRHILLAFALLTISTLAMHAQNTLSTTDVPRTISYQGLLTSTDGTPFTDGRYQVTVTLYGDPQGSQRIWQDNFLTDVIDGVFNLYLGERRELPDLSSMNMPLWVGTSVNGAPEMRPLTPLSASPYALNVADKAITGNKIADGAITSEKLDVDYISEVQIDGEKISAKGTVLNLVGTPSVPLSYDEATQSVTVGRLPAQTGDKEKGATTLASPLGWDSQGDLTDGTIGGQATALGDWLGTTNAAGNGEYALIMKVRNTQIMRYHTAAAASAPNVEGGLGSTVAAASVASTIAGGATNSITGNYQAIGGGENNTIVSANNHYNVIGGGKTNTITQSEYSTVGGGDLNKIGNAANGVHHSGIGSGWDNEVYGSEAVIAGGHNNTVESYASGILVGHDNIIHPNNMFSAIGGGQINSIGAGGFGGADHATIGGGEHNRIENLQGQPIHHSTIGGGWDNEVTAAEAGIASGHNNHVHSYASGILAGHDNIINDNSPFSAVGGGNGNVISTGFNNGTIGGGTSNTVNAPLATIGGGQGNNVLGSHATIPGGDLLLTTVSYAQSAMGFMNAPRGTVVVHPTAAQIAASDDPLFMVGNGNYNLGNPIRSNAFEVSYNGHSVVYDVNGNTNGGGRIPIEGGTYTDNIVYAWGDIDASGAINADFGVSSVAAGGGVYVITIAVNDPLTNPITLNQASITATITDDNGSNGCAFITSSRIGVPGPNQFTIRTYSQDCGASDLPFMFKVTGRQ